MTTAPRVPGDLRATAGKVIGRRSTEYYFGLLTLILIAKYTLIMPRKPKPITVAEAGRRGGKARAERHSHAQLSEWAKLGGWPKGRPRKKTKRKKRGK